jgi:hypothetical protein
VRRSSTKLSWVFSIVTMVSKWGEARRLAMWFSFMGGGLFGDSWVSSAWCWSLPIGAHLNSAPGHFWTLSDGPARSSLEIKVSYRLNDRNSCLRRSRTSPGQTSLPVSRYRRRSSAFICAMAREIDQPFHRVATHQRL